MQDSKLRRIFRPWVWCAAAGAAFAGFVPVVVFGSALSQLLYVVLFLPLTLAGAVMIAAVLGRRHALSILAGAVVYCAVTCVLLYNAVAVQNGARWYLYGGAYKQRVLAEAGQSGQMKHAVWSGWGFAGSKTVVYLVYDPSNSLAGAVETHASGKFAGIPCSVARVRRLANRWYAVEFPAGESWNRCGGKSARQAGTP